MHVDRFLIIAVSTVLASSARAGVLFVDDDAPPAGDGLNWESAYRFLQDALADAAANAGTIDEIRVAQGIYRPDRSEVTPAGSGDRSASFELWFLLDGVAIRGGYAGLGAPDPDERDLALYETVLSGDLAGDDGPDFTGNADNSYHVVTASVGAFETAVLDGFSITAGNADGPSPDHRVGGGMFIDAASPTVSHCTFRGNWAQHGGGMYTVVSESTVTGCTFTINSAGLGGGLFTVSSNLTVLECTFIDNSTVDNVFRAAGGGLHNLDSDTLISRCVFQNNQAAVGGGLSIKSGAPVVSECTFHANSACFGFGLGGGMFNQGYDVLIADCVFTANVAGGFASNGGGMNNNVGAVATVVNCTFVGNTAEKGGGMLNLTSEVSVTNCTLTDNSASETAGGVLNVQDAVVTMTNCIVWDNDLEQIVNDDGAITTVEHSNVQGAWPGVGNIDADPLFVDPGNGDVRLSPDSPCIDAADNTAVPEDITTDLEGNPRFLDVPETPDTGNGEPPIVDMGAYESLGGGCLAITSQEIVCHGDGTTFTYTAEGINACTGGTTEVTFTGSGGAVGEEMCFTVLVSDGGFCCSTEICVTVPDCSGSEDLVCPADLDGDGQVGITDFLIVLGAWNGPGGDTNGDGTTDILDFLAVIGNWGPC